MSAIMRSNSIKDSTDVKTIKPFWYIYTQHVVKGTLITAYLCAVIWVFAGIGWAMSRGVYWYVPIHLLFCVMVLVLPLSLEKKGWIR